ncbi:MAG: hypothetical protein KBT61_05515 [Paraperlucidibaca sp.]|nr:hypothetical protein [Paraperlucidibaca sp.]MBQ0722946.1 hypothetical protein [Paraperlucidibaca sp.]MBQ0842406.1 hypothetical protein [Paraperlucidibaca sp.]|tara:strand:+ start:1321 stop:1518 length:198 start_codon:yes stop_codon:yes gene_type:complete
MSNIAAAVRIAIAAGVGGGSIGGAIAGPVGAFGGAVVCSIGSFVVVSGLLVVAAASDAVDQQRKK